ncbi:MAG: DUF1768 domain-containing protein [Oscillospiraceae bacterium]|nr:DUF1768 domain-containing protein [Oscillospiraceae bacterium]
MKETITIIYGDIEKIKADCIVNAANRHLHIGNGVCGAIFEAAGVEAMTEACNKIGGCAAGDAVVTPAFNLPASYVIHAVGPKLGVDDNGPELLRSAYLQAMERVKELGCHSVVFPLISSGAFNDGSWTYERFWTIAITAIRDFQASNKGYQIDVTFACHGRELIAAGKKVLQSVQANSKILEDEQNEKYVFFWHEYEENGCFSQWYKAPFTVEGITYQTCEQYMMAKKALLFNDIEHYYLIMNEPDPRKDKAYGKDVRNYDGELWHSCNEEIIFRANYAKFSQNPELKAALLATDDKQLVEASPKDKIYGIGLEASDPRATDPTQWKGTNLLGKMLVKVRTVLSGGRL